MITEVHRLPMVRSELTCPSHDEGTSMETVDSQSSQGFPDFQVEGGYLEIPQSGISAEFYLH